MCAAECALRKCRGSLVLESEEINSIACRWLDALPDCKHSINRIERDGEKYHITVAHRSELSGMEEAVLPPLSGGPSPVSATLVDLGVGYARNGDAEAWFVVIYCPEVANIRQHLGLAPKNLHITLGFSPRDVHGVPKGVHQLVSHQSTMPSIVSKILVAPLCGEQSIILSWIVDRISASAFSTTTMSNNDLLDADCAAVALRDIGRFASRTHNSRLATTSFTALLEAGYWVGLHAMIKLTTLHGGSVNDVTKHLQLPLTLRELPISLRSASKEGVRMQVVKALNANATELGQDKRRVVYSTAALASDTGVKDTLSKQDSLVHELHRLAFPRNFGFVMPGLAGMAMPTSKEHVMALSGVGITNIITILEKPLSVEMRAWCAKQDIEVHFFEVPDRTPPTLEELKAMTSIIQKSIDEGGATVVHCMGGVGRTNTAIIAYAMLANGLSAADGIQLVTSLRKIILDASQKEQLQTWWRYVRSPTFTSAETTNKSPARGRESAPLSAKASGGTKKMAPFPLPPLIILCGYPCSGKSSFAHAIINSRPLGSVVRVNKDEMRGRGECDNLLMDNIRKPNTTVIIDCCCLTAAVRAQWMDTAHHPRTWCVHLNVGLDECRRRIQHRKDHPTIKTVEGGLKVIRSMTRQFEAPEAAEGFEKLIELTSGEEVIDLLKQWRVSDVLLPKGYVEGEDAGEEEAKESYNTYAYNVNEETDTIVKFPRTSHAINLGSATRDDKILGAAELSAIVGSNRYLCIEEKLDGANMGISLDRNGSLRVQNRSHWVTSDYHAQFKPLTKWLMDHAEDLHSVLGSPADRLTLYGEWLHATHSVEYRRLPGWFVAYDLYDAKTEKFASRRRLEATMEGTNIPLTPLLVEGMGCVKDVEELKKLVDGPSAFGAPGVNREGIVIRHCEGDVLVSRAKLVRHGFCAGNERWNRAAKLATNAIAHSSYTDEA